MICIHHDHRGEEYMDCLLHVRTSNYHDHLFVVSYMVYYCTSLQHYAKYMPCPPIIHTYMLWVPPNRQSSHQQRKYMRSLTNRQEDRRKENKSEHRSANRLMTPHANQPLFPIPSLRSLKVRPAAFLAAKNVAFVAFTL